uniref:Uncharacterized protein n=1 Tax=candidate division CPR3 bacterium TaxID=2268181 RepID=A0A7C4M0M8_UNCC3
MLETIHDKTESHQLFLKEQKEEKEMKRLERTFAEETMQIKRSDFPKGILVPVSNTDEDYLKKGQYSQLEGKKGTFVVRGFNYDLKVDYFVNHNGKEQIELNICYQEKSSSPFDARRQTIRLKQYELNHGTDWLFLCPLCGTEVCKILYLTNSYFGCRKCKKIKYGKCYLNNKVPHQRHFYYLNRLYKIIRDWPDIKRPFYNGSMTKKTMRLFDLYAKAGIKVPDQLKGILALDNIILEEQMEKLKHSIRDLENVQMI